MGVSEKTLALLEPWLEDQGPNSSGEWGMHCPFHNDNKRSASLNTERAVFYCQTCDLGCSAIEVVRLIKEGKYNNEPKNKVQQRSTGGGEGKLSDALVAGWASALLGDRKRLKDFERRRGLDSTTIESYEIGWDSGQRAYTIPVRDEEGQLVNVRHYTLDPGDRRKIWSVAGHGTPTLYPVENWREWGSVVVVCEGELDTLLTIQKGFDAVTRTGAAKVWQPAWNKYFKDKVVYLCHDMDTTGQEANRAHAEELAKVASQVFIVELPYPVGPKDGKDLTDYWQEGHSSQEFMDLMAEAHEYQPHGELQAEEIELEEVAVIDSFDPSRVGKHLRMSVTIVGKVSSNYLVPRTVHFTCDQKAGVKCKTCIMGKEEGIYDGDHTMDFAPDDPQLLEFMGSTNNQLSELLRVNLGAEKCHRLMKDATAHHSMEEIFVRPSVDVSRHTNEAPVYRKFITVNKHTTRPNNTVQVMGAIQPNPRTQQNEFQVWELESTATNVDYFDITEDAMKLLARFKVKPGQSPLAKAMSIAHDISSNVTHIYERDEMHVFFDLIYHSVLRFEFQGRPVEKGWLEGLIVGDTRTGKSEIATVLTNYYGSGEMISCESATYAGVVGGLQQLAGKEWAVTWGAIPLNDRRLVILDEVSGLKVDEISQMSSIRSSGEAQLTKIQAERTPARTRLVWLSNPRDGRRMGEFTYGVQVIRPLIGNNEDIARFDMAMTVASTEVESAAYNTERNTNRSSRRYSSKACHTLLNWVWTRKSEDVVWAAGAEQAVLDAAEKLGKSYLEDPPLIQAANVRMKIARMSVALAARVCSTDAKFEKVIVKKEHVRDAVKFLNDLYGAPGFGYGDLSSEYVKDKAKARAETQDVERYLTTKPGLSKFLRSCAGHFRRMDLEDMLNMGREEANATVNKLYQHRMIARAGPNIRINPELHILLREMEVEE